MATITFQDEPLPSPVTSSYTGHTRTISSSTYEPSRSGSTAGLFAHPAPPPPTINAKSFWSAKARRENRFVRGAEERDPANPPPSRPTASTITPVHASASPAPPPAAEPSLPTTPPASTPPLPSSSAGPGAARASPSGPASLGSSPSTSTTSTLSSAGSPASASSEIDLERQEEKPLTKPKKGRRYGFRRSAGGGGKKKRGKKGKVGKEVLPGREYSAKGDSVSLIHMTGIGVSVLVMIGLGFLLYFVLKKDHNTMPR